MLLCRSLNAALLIAQVMRWEGVLEETGKR
jgi:hypothetical protein